MPWFCEQYSVLVPPSEEAVMIDEAMEYIKASSSESNLIALYITACRKDLEKRLGRSLVAQTLVAEYAYPLPGIALVTSMIDTTVHLLQTPVTQVIKVEYMASAWVEYTSDLYHVDGDMLYLDDMSQLSGEDEWHIRVTYECGPKVTDAADKLMLLQYIAHRYLYREDDTMPDGIKESILRSKDWRL